jgi:hypothetical protein
MYVPWALPINNTKTGKIFGQVMSPNPRGEFDVSFMCFEITKDESFLYGVTHGVNDRKDEEGEKICELVMYSIDKNWVQNLFGDLGD